jgi:hypothetical protein
MAESNPDLKSATVKGGNTKTDLDHYFGFKKLTGRLFVGGVFPYEPNKN